ncbi:MAG TPA: SCO family protein [Candidatus Limnocylindrales bacterium]|nr:SCO family protein [Candidatus Limnocylindrales bacterium]
MRRTFPMTAAALSVVLTASAAMATPFAPVAQGTPQAAPSASQGPTSLQGVDFQQRLGEQLPLQTPFVDENGKQVMLGDYFGSRPVILVMAYYECPMLCTLVLNGTVKALRPMSFTAGDEFDVVVISIDPTETPELARKKKDVYLESYERRGSGGGWHFLTGTEQSIRAVADAAGFSYRYLPQTGDYAHAAGIIVATPQGRLARYLYGIEYSSRDIRLALVEAAEEKIGNLVDALMLFCFRYDASIGKYSTEAMAAVRAGGVATLIALLGFIVLSRRHERRSPSRS